MKKYIFLTGQYLPNPGATGGCVHKIAKCMVQKGYAATTICYQSKEAPEEIDGVRIVGIKPLAFDKFKGTKSLLIKKGLQLQSMVNKLVYLNYYPMKSKSLIRRYIKAVERIIDVQEDVTVIASYVPVEAVAVLAHIKKRFPNITTVYYSTDTLSNEDGNAAFLSNEFRKKKGMMWEHRLFEQSDLVLIMDCHKIHYLSKEFERFHSKMKVVNFPYLEKMDSVSTTSNQQLTMVYAGSLYRKLRNPQFVCDSLLEVMQEINYKVVFMGAGDCHDILDLANQQSKGKLINKGMVPHTLATKEMSAASVLISIGNAQTSMMPSKIYEYMSTGKPILHFYTYEKDPCLPPLREYGNALCIEQGESNIKEKILKFLREAKTETFENVREKFIMATPEYSADIIRGVICSGGITNEVKTEYDY